MKTNLNLKELHHDINFFLSHTAYEEQIKNKLEKLFKVCDYCIKNNTSIYYSCIINNISTSSFYRWIRLLDQNIYALRNKSTRPHNIKYKFDWDELLPYIKRLLNNTKRSFKLNLPSSSVWIYENKGIRISVTTLYKYCDIRTNKKKRKKKKHSQTYTVNELGYLQVDGLNINNPNLMNKKGTKHHIFTAIDQCSRFAFAYCYDEKSRTNAIDFSNKAINFFESNQIEIKHIQTDNGAEFVHTRSRFYNKSYHRIVSSFEINLASKFITFNTIKVNHPQHNGKIERFNGTLRRSVIDYYESTKTNLNITEINKKLSRFIDYYNHEKHHRGIKKTPLKKIVEILEK